MDTQRQLPSDGQLAVAARDGVAEAWAELELRHGRIALAVARKLYGRHGKSRTRIGLDKLRAEVLHGAGVVVDDRNRALRAFRPRFVAAVTDGGFDDPGASAADELHALAMSFAALPEPWQAALWHHHIDLEAPSGFTDVVGRSEANTDLLIGRATDDLLSGFLDELRLAGVTLNDAEQTDRRNTIGVMLPQALVPRVAAMSVADYRFAIGAESTFASASVPAPRAVPTPESSPPAAPTAPSLPPPPVIPVAIDEVAAEAPGDDTHEVPQVRPTQRPTLPTPAHLNDGPATPEKPPLSAALRHRRILVVALLSVVIGVAVVGALVVVANALWGDVGSASDGPSAAVGDPADDGGSDQTNLFGVQITVGQSDADPGADIDVEAGAVGPIFEGGRGMIRVQVANNGADDAMPAFTITPPAGITVDKVVGATCAGLGTPSSSVRCDLTIPAGNVLATEIHFTLDESAIGRLILDSNVAIDPLDVPIHRVADMRYGAVGRGDVVMVGNSVLSCDDSAPACAEARAGTDVIFSRRDLPASFVGAAPEFGVVNSSSAMLDIGEADVAAAFLFWSGDVETDVALASDAPVDRVTVAAPDAPTATVVEADEVLMSQDGTQYLASADVTGSVAAAGSGSYRVGNVHSVEAGGSHAGWSLVVVTSDNRAPLRQLMVLSPFDAVDGDAAAQVVVPTSNVDPTAMALHVLSFDTDRGTVGDTLVVNGDEVGEDDGERFDGSISGGRDPEFVDNFGTGIAAYAIDLDASDTVDIEATSTDDEFVVGAIALTIDIE